MILRTVAVFAFFVLAGCAPKTLMPDKIADIRKVGVVTTIPENNLKVLDHRVGTMRNTYTYGQFGAIGALMESVILLGIREYNSSNKSISGVLDDSRLATVDLSLKDYIDSDLYHKISKKYVVVEPQYFDKKNLSSGKRSECIAEAKKMEIDALVFLDIAYGLVSHNDKQATVSIDADMVVYNVKDKEVILKKVIESDQYFREYRTIEEFSQSNGKLLIEDLQGAISGFSTYVAQQLEIWQ